MSDSSVSPPFSPPQRLLMGPGPSSVHPRVYRALSTAIVGHMDPEFLAILDRIQAMLRQAFGTRNRVAVTVSGTGSAGIEAAMANMVEPGEKVLACVHGAFGARLAEIAGRVGGDVQRLERPWGEVFEPEEVAAALDRDPEIRVVGIVNAETSTGAHQPIDAIGRICRERGRYLVVDAVTSLGGEDVRVDDWMADVCYSGSQKCLSCPPGLSPITFNERALEKVRARKRRPVSWYLDIELIDGYWSPKRIYHHTPPISMNFAIHEALAVALEEGLENRIRRHRLNGRALAAGLEALGFRYLAPPGRRLPMLHAVHLPEGVEDAPARRRLLDDYSIEIGGGLGAFAGKVWRIGLMGENSRRKNVVFFLGALEAILADLGIGRGIGAGLEAAARVYSESSGSSAGGSSGRPAAAGSR